MPLSRSTSQISARWASVSFLRNEEHTPTMNGVGTISNCSRRRQRVRGERERERKSEGEGETRMKEERERKQTKGEKTCH